MMKTGRKAHLRADMAPLWKEDDVTPVSRVSPHFTHMGRVSEALDAKCTSGDCGRDPSRQGSLIGGALGCCRVVEVQGGAGVLRSPRHMGGVRGAGSSLSLERQDAPTPFGMR